MEENQNASRFFHLTSSNLLGSIPTKPINCSGKLFSQDHSSIDEENLTDGEGGGTDVENQTSVSVSPQILSKDPVFEYRINSEFSKIVDKDVFDIADFGSISKFVSSHIEWGLEPGSFLITNLSVIVSQWKQWQAELPMVEPFYAVKCNPDPVILRLLASLGCKFDCASMGEIDLVLNGLGENQNVPPSSIVYANPAKMNHMIQFAAENGVRLTVFDCEDELFKIAGLMKNNQDRFDLLLRLSTNDAKSVCVFSHKFGCPVSDAPRLLAIAKSLGLNVVGVSFHVGSGCRDAATYTEALADSLRYIFFAMIATCN